MQINLLSPATSKGLKNTNSPNKTLLTSAVILWVIILGGYLILFILNEYTIKRTASINEELQQYQSVTQKINRNNSLISELTEKNNNISEIEKKKIIYSKIISEINSLLTYQVRITQIEISQGTDTDHYLIKINGTSTDVKAIAEFQRNLQSFNIDNTDNQRLKYSDSKITLVDQSQSSDQTFNISITIKKDVMIND